MNNTKSKQKRTKRLKSYGIYFKHLTWEEARTVFEARTIMIRTIVCWIAVSSQCTSSFNTHLSHWTIHWFIGDPHSALYPMHPLNRLWQTK